MKNFFKSLLIIPALIGLFSFLTMGHAAFALSAQDAAQQLAGDSQFTNPDKIFQVLTKIVQYTYTIFFIVAIIFILLAAFSFLTAKGDPEAVKNARAQILWASVAIAVALISVAAAQIIKSFIGA